MSGNRAQDHHAEQELSKYLDKNIYPVVLNYYKKVYNNYDVRGERVVDRKNQLDGIDYRFTIKNNQNTIYINIDEKSQLYYMKKEIHTFAFEIDSLQKGFISPGWLFDQDKKTNVYMLIYPKSDKDLASVTINDFHDVECYLIDRNIIFNLLNDKGFTKEFCESYSSYIRNNGKDYYDDNGNRYKYLAKDTNDMLIREPYFTYSYNIFEHPINLILLKNTLIDLSFLTIKK